MKKYQLIKHNNSIEKLKNIFIEKDDYSLDRDKLIEKILVHQNTLDVIKSDVRLAAND